MAKHIMIIGCIAIAVALLITFIAGIANVSTLVLASLGYGLVALGGTILAVQAVLRLIK